MVVEGSYDMQRFVMFALHFANSLRIDVASLLLLMLTHRRLEMEQLLEVRLFIFLVPHLLRTMYCHQVQQLVNIIRILDAHVVIQKRFEYIMIVQ
jgi:hypothetical protein